MSRVASTKNTAPSRFQMQGLYQDELFDAEGDLVSASAWQSNRIVESCYVLLAALMKREVEASGLLYWAVGEGDASWDTRMPSPSVEDTALFREVARKPLNLADIVYLDENNRPTEFMSSRLQVTARFSAEDFTSAENGGQVLREFALFGGSATESENSGLMVDVVTHPRIMISDGMVLSRNLHLSFGGGGAVSESVSGFGLSLPVSDLDGVGPRYAATLSAVGVRTLGELIDLNPHPRIGNIPRVKLREFRAKARIVAHSNLDLSAFTSMSSLSVSEILSTAPRRLASRSSRLTVTEIVRLQEDLALLQVALDDRTLQKTSLSDLSGV